jgi:hypothetical protein
MVDKNRRIFSLQFDPLTLYVFFSACNLTYKPNISMQASLTEKDYMEFSEYLQGREVKLNLYLLHEDYPMT